MSLASKVSLLAQAIAGELSVVSSNYAPVEPRSGKLWFDTGATTSPLGSNSAADMANFPTDGHFRTNISRPDVGGSGGTTIAGRTSFARLWFNAGEVVSGLTFRTGATGFSTITSGWFALYDATGSLLTQTADQAGSSNWAANTDRTLYFPAKQNIFSDGFYYCCLNMRASTSGTLQGQTGVLATMGLSPIVAGTADTGLFATAPSTIGSIAATAGIPWVRATSI